MKGCLWGLPLSPSPRIPEFHAPVPHSLGESHISSVEQELLPPVSAHQRHRLLIQPNLCHTAVVREARHRLRDNRAGLTRLQAPRRGSVVTPLPMQRHAQGGTHRGGTGRSITANSPSLKGSLSRTLPMDTNTPHCDASGTFTPGQVRTDSPIRLQFPWAAHPSWAHRDVIQLVVGHGLLHHVWLLCCPWHRHREPREGGHRTPSAAAAVHLQTEPCPRQHGHVSQGTQRDKSI